ncbi:hypothetical protein KGM_204493 [Danaus plexippus plexippus]|uniref:Uncharacterized protein n=1 Tax=Danaus plexippus plexippus TaxID=278856 RepID=A0A212FFM5_DANPL|nr:hypothetical protein KGM_204493 [Danaus plexippus plexippus]
MLLVFSFFVSIPIISIVGDFIDPLESIPLLPPTYKDIFIASKGGRPQLGTTSATCWARGGICIQVRHCSSDKGFDATVSGCSSRFKVCCRVFKQLPPTVGVQRSRQIEKDDDEEIEDIDKSLGSGFLVSLSLP